MGLQLVRVILSVVLVLLLLWLTKTSALVNASLAKGSCQAECGNISIPYPFGIGPNCYFDIWYSVECKNNTKPYLTRIDLEVLEISIDDMDSYVQVNFPVISANCPKSSTTINNSGNTATDTATSMVDVRNSPFVLSTTANIFMAVGCNNHALMTYVNDSTIAGCISICNTSTHTSGGSCFGINCCQSPITRPDLQAFKLTLQRLHQTLRILQWKNIGVANLAGVISLAAGLFMWVTSLKLVRRTYFELFFYTHQLYIVFVVFLALHVGDFIFTIAAGGIFLFVLDRFLRFCQSRKTVNVISASCLPCGIVELVISKPGSDNITSLQSLIIHFYIFCHHNSHCFLFDNVDLQYNALSFIFLQIRELSWLQWHLFSVSSCPLDGKYHIAVLIKVLGKWTKKLRGSILNGPKEEPQEEQPLQPHSNLTVSVKGPYGHSSPYHLTYKNLILVAGGIGISPFLAILSDILHHIKDNKPCMPRNILIVWAVKKSDELPLLYSLDMESICPFFSDILNLEIQTYVTRESEPQLEDGQVSKSVNFFGYPIRNKCGISVLVGTGNIIWSGVYVMVSTIGLVLSVGLLQIFYINPFDITYWWYKGLLFVICMVASPIVFGGVVIGLWHLWDRKTLAREAHDEDDGPKIDTLEGNEARAHKESSQDYVAS